jgi:hypothetical protein
VSLSRPDELGSTVDNVDEQQIANKHLLPVHKKKTIYKRRKNIFAKSIKCYIFQCTNGMRIESTGVTGDVC